MIFGEKTSVTDVKKDSDESNAGKADLGIYQAIFLLRRIKIFK